MADSTRRADRAAGRNGVSGTDGAPARRSRNATRTRDDILVAAGKHFARRGYSHVTLKEIADDVGVTPALIVRYYGTKLALFEEVAKGSEHTLSPYFGGDRREWLLARARELLAYFQDDASSSGIALLRSLDLDDGALFRSELERRIRQLWSSEITGTDAEIRLKLIAGIMPGVGLFSLGALTDPDRPPLDPADAERITHYLVALFEVCIDP